MSNTIGRFGHHPDPAADFCVEVEALQGLVYDMSVGLSVANPQEIEDRIFRAMQFSVGGDECAVNAKAALRDLEKSFATIRAEAEKGGAG